MSYFGGIGLLYAPKKSCLSVTSKSSVPIFDAVCARVLICVFVCMCVCVWGGGVGGVAGGTTFRFWGGDFFFGREGEGTEMFR